MVRVRSLARWLRIRSPWARSQFSPKLSVRSTEKNLFYNHHLTFTLPHLTSTALVDQISTGLLQGDTSGILGLAFQPLAASRATPFWQTLAQSNQLTTPEFAFWLSRVTGTSAANSRTMPNNQPGGAFTLGGTNSSLFTGDIDFVDIPSGVTPSFWFLELQCMFSPSFPPSLFLPSLSYFEIQGY